MWFGKNKKIQLIILLTIFTLPVLTQTEFTRAENPDPYFSISVLAPSTYGYTYATLMVEQLPKIGIAVDVFDQTGWVQISPRTFEYPGPFPIPAYSEGGFDILCIGYGWGLDIDLTELFHSRNITPNKWNFYQYDRPEMDWALGNYSQSFVLADRIQYAHDIQTLLYEDVPQATISCPQDVFPHAPNLVAESWNPLFWDTSYQDNTGDTEFHYGCPADFEDFHPMKTESVYDAQWTQQIYGGLVERTPEAPYYNAYGPYAATSFSSANGINYTVQLDPDLVFADGHVCNATDVEYSYDLLINPLFSQPDYSFYSQYIDNKTIEIVSEYEIKVNFLQYYVFQDSNLAIDILPKHIWGSINPEDHEAQSLSWAVNDVNDSKIMGIGPYYLHDYDGTNGVIHLKANTYWDTWGGHATQLVDDLYFEFWYNKEGALAALAA
ncbi:MAG: ABC transporter substrate-binding protein, partial [Candidatus Heimdallarchaeota archaeon]